jgi:creatinine amidohydrolase
MQTHYWADLTSEALAALDRENLIAVLPIAAIEQHGPHLPLSVDTDIINAVINAGIAKMPADLPVLFLPTQVIGKSNEHTRYPGTLTHSAATLMHIWMELAECVVNAGIKKFMMFNSHGGQMNLMDVVLRDLRVKHNILVVSSSWYNLGLPEGMISAHELKHGIHGGEVETSVMLAIAPDKVKMERAQNFKSLTEKLEREYKYLSITPTAKIGWQTQDLNPQGACGNAAAASAAKGQAILEFVSDRFVELLREVQRAPLSLLNPDPAWR